MTIKDLREDIFETETLKDVARSYTEISSIKLRKIRTQTENSRSFFQDLSNIFAILNYMAKSKNPNTRSSETVIILITSNFRFYGKTSNQAGRLFMQYTQKNPCEKIVIGKLGAKYLQSQNYSQGYNQLTFKKDVPNQEEMTQLIKLVKNYGRILVVFSEFKTILTQVPVIKDLTQTQIEAQVRLPLEYTFILEPEIHKMMEFFDSQIKNVLLSGTFLEAELARVASRLIIMDQAESNAQKLLKRKQQQLIFAKRDLFNKKTLETWAATRSLI